jgi:transcriptional regulator with PAS, ATPase and Fis domain
VKADVRVVAATNRNLEELVKEGRFREDLYYRINVFKLLLPPLRNRKEDIPLLCEHFIRKYNRLIGKDIQGISPEALHVLMSHNFQGNIRELENIIEYAIVVCRDDKIGAEHLPEYLGRINIVSRKILDMDKHNKPSSLSEIERSFILDSLERNNWNRKRTSKELGMHPTTLWRKIRRLNIIIPRGSDHSGI